MMGEQTPVVLSGEINALPERVRSFIHDLESRADPAGDVRRGDHGLVAVRR
jgi:hypothetical protein